MYINDPGSLIRLVLVDRLRWVLVSKRLLRDITIKAYDYEFFKLSEECDFPVHPKIRSMLNLILSPIVCHEMSAWGFVKSICIELTNTSLPLDVDMSYAWLDLLFNRMQEIESLRLIGFTWNPYLIKIFKNSGLQKVNRLDLEILLLHEQDEQDFVEWNDLFKELFTNASQTVDHLSISSSSDCMNPMILLQLFEIKCWKSINIYWKAEMDSGIFQLLLSRVIAWVNYNANLELCKIEIFLPRMMENVSIPTYFRNDGHKISTLVDPISKKFTFLIIHEKFQKLTHLWPSICISSTSTLLQSESCWTNEDGSGIFYHF